MAVPFRERNPVVIGAISLAVIAALMLAAFKADSLPLVGGGTSYSAAFTEAGGLKANDEVRIAGVRVGKVNAVELEGSHVRVDFKVDKGARFGTTTGAAIKVKTLLGAMYLGLEPAGPGQLKKDAEIPVDRTASPYDVVQAFSGQEGAHEVPGDPRRAHPEHPRGVPVGAQRAVGPVDDHRGPRPAARHAAPQHQAGGHRAGRPARRPGHADEAG
jgi:hypothetical protein